MRALLFGSGYLGETWGTIAALAGPREGSLFSDELKPRLDHRRAAGWPGRRRSSTATTTPSTLEVAAAREESRPGRPALLIVTRRDLLDGRRTWRRCRSCWRLARRHGARLMVDEGARDRGRSARAAAARSPPAGLSGEGRRRRRPRLGQGARLIPAPMSARALRRSTTWSTGPAPFIFSTAPGRRPRSAAARAALGRARRPRPEAGRPARRPNGADAA